MSISNEEFEAFAREAQGNDICEARDKKRDREQRGAERRRDEPKATTGGVAAGYDMSQMLETITVCLVQQIAQMMAMLSRSQATSGAENHNGIQNYNVMPDLSKAIDEFDGEKGPVEAKEWLRQVYVYACSVYVPDGF